MCGRYTLRELDLIRAGLGFELLPRFEEFSETHRNGLYNIAPSQLAPVVRVDENGKPVIDLAKWGFVPSWATGKPMPKPINAKSETAAASGMYRTAFKRGRVLIPADGFYEPKGAKTLKNRPWYYFQKPDASLFAFGGLLESGTFALLTTAPGRVVGAIHDRQLLIIPPGDYQRWLDPAADVADLLQPGEYELESWPVSNAAKRPANEGPELIERVESKP